MRSAAQEGGGGMRTRLSEILSPFLNRQMHSIDIILYHLHISSVLKILDPFDFYTLSFDHVFCHLYTRRNIVMLDFVKIIRLSLFILSSLNSRYQLLIIFTYRELNILLVKVCVVKRKNLHGAIFLEW